MYPALRYIQDTFKIHWTFQDTMYLNPQIHDTFEDTYLEPYLRPGCISSPWMNFRIWDTCIPLCIFEVSRMYPLCCYVSSNLCRYMYPAWIVGSRMDPAWIPHVSWLYPDCILKCRQDASKIHVSWFCISVYLDVSWWRVHEDTCILMSWCILICIQCDIKEAHKIRILDSFGIRVKYM